MLELFYLIIKLRLTLGNVKLKKTPKIMIYDAMMNKLSRMNFKSKVRTTSLMKCM